MIFELTIEQRNQIKEWEKEHTCSYRTDDYGVKNERYVGAIGGATSYIFTPNGIGESIEAKCACGETINVTDVASW